MNTTRVLYEAWLLSARRHHRAFASALRDPVAAQERLLRRILRENRGSALGRRLGLDGVRSLSSYAQRVSPVRYDDLEPWLTRVRAGERGVLTSSDVRRLVPSGGSNGAHKLLPFTDALGADFARGVGAWISDLARRHPAIKGGPGYWSVSPAMAVDASGSVVPVGFEDDAAYLGRWMEPLVRRVLVAPSCLRHARPMSSFSYATLRTLVACRELRLISVWHPTFFELLLDALPEHFDRLIEDVRAGTVSAPLPDAVERQLTRGLRPDRARAAELRRAGPEPSRIWPRLALLSAWGDAAARGPFDRLAERLGTVAMQPKGILATEGFVSLPFGGQHPLAITSSVIELLAPDGEVRPLDRVRRGEVYEVLLTTSGGLYRYRLGDLVEVTGFAAKTPSVRLLGRADRVVDRVGEKLSEAFVVRAIRDAYAPGRPPPFAMLAPDGAGYALFVDQPATTEVPRRLRKALRKSPGFAYAQDLGQLGPVEVVCCEGATGRYLERMHRRGQTLGDIKPTALSGLSGWRDAFAGNA